ncbi:uncharacterized protein LOC132282341 [Cornus florida]|uniref:uncharacterized protein LOC132282341 n=1 Tax=Cornus florida TaxID=4283 RepID=UPI0028963595|nr:uncharacterized protein LOC132282341 [Cornus florida]
MKSLRKQVEILIARGELTDYLINPGQQRQHERTRATLKIATENHPVRVINTIHGRPEEDEQPENSYRIHLKQAHKLRKIGEINDVGYRPNPTQFSFQEEDLRKVQHPHEDPLVISLLVANCLVKRVLIDPSSSANIITKWTFDHLKLVADQICPTRNPLVGFNGRRVEPIDVITLSVTAAKRSLKENFVVMDIHPTYNLLIGRGWIHRMEKVPSTLHQVMRCVGPNGREASSSFKGTEEPEEECPTEEPLEAMQIVAGDEHKLTYIGTLQSAQEKNELTEI